MDTKLITLNKKINSNKTKHVLVENEFKKLQTFDSIYLRDKSHFEEDGTPNYLVFQSMYLLVLVGVIIYIYIFGNLKDCLMKILLVLK